ncbi:hypothetical protein Tco_0726378 [Tanacetum coccineum]|uniref:Uncharacterized protein n=1 Tax=Tanacetum coccineum TaxID=301880 RepID=A0ABQ4YHZ7_9ASTR
MSKKAKDPEVIAKKISYKPIDYEKLNRLIKDFGKHFTPQQELSAEQAFWFYILNPTIEPSYTPPVIVDVPSKVPKKRTTPNALEEGEWGFEHTKNVFNNEIIPFLKSLKDIFNVFDKDLLNEITEVQTVFDQMEAAVQQSSVDKKCLVISKKEILLENDRLLQKFMSQDVLLTMMNSMSFDYVNMEMQKCESCDKLSMQLKQEVFQNDESCVSQNAVEIPEYFEINDLKARLQDKETTIWKEIVEHVVHIPSATTIAPGMFKLDLVSLPPSELDFACKYATRIQELLVYVPNTCPNAITPSTKMVAVTHMNNVKNVRSELFY